MYRNKKTNYPYYPSRSFENFKQVLEDAAASDVRPAFRYKKGKEIVDVSYKQFLADTRALGSALAEKGLADKHIAVIGPNSYKWLTVFLTALNGESVFVPIDKELPFEDVVRLVNEGDAEVLFFAGFYADKVKENRDAMPGVKLFADFDAKADEDGILCYDALLGHGKELYENGYDAYTNMIPVYKNTKMIVFTSGTTGNPKGVMLSLENLVSCVYYGLQVSTVYDVCLSVLPYHHTYEAVCSILVSLRMGATVCINESLRSVAANLKLFKPTYILLVPLFIESFYKKIWANAEDTGKAETLRRTIAMSNRLLRVGVDMRPVLFKSIRDVFGGNLIKIVSGGAPIRAELGEFFDAVGITLVNGYGITECSPLVAANRDYYYNFTSVGNPLPCLEMQIFEPNADGEGEIGVRGPTVMMGYYKNPEKTAEVLSEDGWFRTGDYGKIGADGRLYITGRKKNMIVLKNGKNIYPEEIEDELASSDVIAEVIVSAVRSEDGEEVGLSAEVYPDPDRTKDRTDDEVYALVKTAVEERNEKVPVYKKVTKVTIRRTPFDKTTSGKIRRTY